MRSLPRTRFSARRAVLSLALFGLALAAACEQAGVLSPAGPSPDVAAERQADESAPPTEPPPPSAPPADAVDDTGAVCVPERCNGVDDDCDGEVDEDWPERGVACDGPDDDACADGTWACDAAGLALVCDEAEEGGREELCNGADDDCDGATDEGLHDPDGDGVWDCPDYTKDPVVMTHGFMGGRGITWIEMKRKLVRDGWPPEFLYVGDFRDGTGCNPEHAEEIAAWVQELKEQTGRDKVDILAHSMGGLDARWYIKHRCGYRHVRDVVTLSGAHHGAWVGCVDPAQTCGAVDLCRGLAPDAWQDNPVLAEINACDETPGEDILYLCIWSDWDEIVRPPRSATLDGARNIQMEHNVGHAGIVLEDEPYEWVKIGLDGGGANDNPAGTDPCYDLCAPGL